MSNVHDLNNGKVPERNTEVSEADDELEHLHAIYDFKDVGEQMSQINGHYQNIEILTGGDFVNLTQTDLVERLKKIRKINGQIGQITKDWI